MKDFIKIISRQFLAGIPLKHFDWPIEFEYWHSLELQRQLLNATIRHPLTKKFNVSQNYKRIFLKHVIHKLEKSEFELLEAVYEDYAELVQLNDSFHSYCDKIYIVDDNLQVVIRECTAIISDGTTGLVTWPAAKALAEFCVENDELLRDRNLFELGCGLGFTGLVVCKRCRPRSYIFSDYHTRVLDSLRHNLNLNQPDETRMDVMPEKAPSVFSYGTSTLSVLPLHWDDSEQLLALGDQQDRPDVILAADVIYDVDIIPSFFNVVVTLLGWPSRAHSEKHALPTRHSSGDRFALVALTERNQETVETFLHHAGNLNLKCEEQPPSKRLFFYERLCPVRVIKLSAAQHSS